MGIRTFSAASQAGNLRHEGIPCRDLSVIPDPFVLVPRQVKTENGYKPDAGVLA